MQSARRTSRPLLTYACAVGVAFLGTWGVTASEARRPAVTVAAAPPATTLRAPAIVVEADEPLPSPDSLQALLLVDGGRSRRSRRGQTDMLRDVMAATEQVWSSSERASVLAEIARLPDLDSSIVTAVGRAATLIPSTGARSDVVRTLIERQRHAVGASRGAVLAAIGSTASSSERARMLEAFVAQPRLSAAALADALGQASHLPSSGQRSSVLIAAARANRIQGRARALYLGVASAISDRQHQSRALAAIGARQSHAGRHRH